MMGQFIPGKDLKKGEGNHAGWWFVFAGYRLLVRMDEDRTQVPLIAAPEEVGLKVSRVLYLGSLDGAPCYAAQAEDAKDHPSTMAFLELRSLYARLSETFFRLAATGLHLVEWDKTHRFCGKCGAELWLREDERAKECPRCSHLEFPRISPAIIVLIERDGQVLLARAARFAEEMYSVLAGFVEPGESLEEAVFREVKEEVGITVKDIRYFGSQPWPFPDSLMVGFTACHAGGEVQIDGKEIVEAAWFPVDNLPRIPGKISIARQLIDWFVDRNRSS